METSQPNPRPPENVKSGAADAQPTGETNGGATAPKIVAPPPGAPPPQPAADERVRTLSTFHRVMGRPESSALAGPVLVLVGFALAASDARVFWHGGGVQVAARLACT